jgi:SAM-dependent methyltransferase
VTSVFADIYARNRWNGVESLSGPGSGTASTRRLVPELLSLVARVDARSVLDAACGDGFWMPELPGYIGIDLVPDAVERHRARHPGRNLRVADVRRDPLPTVDLVILRDALQHMPLDDARATLANIAASGSRWLLASTYEGGANVDVGDGGDWCPDLQALPFDLPGPVARIFDGWGWEDPDEVRDPRKWLALWSLDEVRR